MVVLREGGSAGPGGLGAVQVKGFGVVLLLRGFDRVVQAGKAQRVRAVFPGLRVRPLAMLNTSYWALGAAGYSSGLVGMTAG